MKVTTSSQIRDAVLAGKKIQAIKLYRLSTGASLSGARAAVNEIERELRASGRVMAKPSLSITLGGAFSLAAILSFLLLAVGAFVLLLVVLFQATFRAA
jgi:hypothetical protein